MAITGRLMVRFSQANWGDYPQVLRISVPGHETVALCAVRCADDRYVDLPTYDSSLLSMHGEGSKVTCGRALTPYSAEAALAVIREHAGLRGPLLPVLHALVKTFGYLDPSAVPLVAAELNLSRADVHGVVTFYHDFRTTPAATHEIRICRAEACQSVGGEALVASASAKLGVPVGSTQGPIALTEVFCLGLCGLAPAAQIDGQPVGRLDQSQLAGLIDGLQASTA